MIHSERCARLQFKTSKLCFSNGHILAFSSDTQQLISLTSTGIEIGHYQCPGITAVDAMAVNTAGLWLADQRTHSLVLLPWPASASGRQEPTNMWRLPPSARIVAMCACHGDTLALLDHYGCCIHLFTAANPKWQTVGRNLYLKKGFEVDQRLGFAHPTDMIATPAGIWIADAGNRRVVHLNTDLSIAHTIALDDYPRRFLAYTSDWLAVAAFSHTLITVSPPYGVLQREPLTQTLADAAICPGEKMAWAITCDGSLERLTFPTIDIARAARSADPPSRLRYFHATSAYADAHALLSADPQWLPTWARLSGDESIGNALNEYIARAQQQLLAENNQIQGAVKDLCRHFFDCYRHIPASQDLEADSAAREDIALALRRSLFRLYANVAAMHALKPPSAHYPEALTNWTKQVKARQHILMRTCRDATENLEKLNAMLDERSVFTLMLSVILAADELKATGGSWPKPIWLETGIFHFINNFYYHVGQLFLLRPQPNLELFVHYTAREFHLYPTKTQILEPLITRMLEFNQGDMALQMLEQIARTMSESKANIHYLFYRIYQQRGDNQRAFDHLKNEVDHFPNRLNLIADLFVFDHLSNPDKEHYRGLLLSKADNTIDANYSLAMTYWHEHNQEQALAYVEREIALFPENTHAIVFKINLLWIMGKHSQLYDFIHANTEKGRQGPTSAQIKLIMARIAAERGNLPEADQWVAAAYQQEKSASDGYATIGWTYYQLDRQAHFDESLARFEIDLRMQRLSPSWKIHLAHLCAEAGDSERAQRLVKAAYQADPNLKNGYAWIGWTFYQGDPANRARRGRTLMKRDWKSRRITTLWALHYLQLADEIDKQTIYQHIASIPSDQFDELQNYPGAFFNLAQVFLARHEYARYIDCLRREFTAFPDNETTARTLLEALRHATPEVIPASEKAELIRLLTAKHMHLDPPL